MSSWHCIDGFKLLLILYNTGPLRIVIFGYFNVFLRPHDENATEKCSITFHFLWIICVSYVGRAASMQL